MGVTLGRIETFFSGTMIPAKAPRVLDIGCSNLHSCTAEGLATFVRARVPEVDSTALELWARYAAAAGTMDSEVGGINGLWLGDLLTRAGMAYRAFDVFDGYKTEIFDLNHQDLADADKGAFDAVFNFGTTEHLLNQFNAFKVIHEACAVGGIMYHDLPMTGWLDHGYFCYNPMLFAHLAEANGYEILRLAFSGAQAGETVRTGLIARYHALSGFVGADGDPAWPDATLPTGSISAVLRKVHDAPFKVSLETSTTVGGVTDAIAADYGGGNAGVSARSEAASRLNRLLRRATDPTLQFDEIMACYYWLLEHAPRVPFPATLERLALHGALQREPSDPAMTARLAVVEANRAADFPLLPRSVDAIPAVGLALDGVEADFVLPGSDKAALVAVLSAYAAYRDHLAVELFPARLEAAALYAVHRVEPGDKSVLIRLGKVMSGLLPLMG